jgi:hypothetical protein
MARFARGDQLSGWQKKKIDGSLIANVAGLR